MGRELHSVPVEKSICPDIYHPAIARDGLLTRLRVPGGVLNSNQCLAIADLLVATGSEYIQVTNRANLQLRALDRPAYLSATLLAKLADCGLAASDPSVDGIRNIMLSPTAGIDAQELIDVRPLATAWHEYLVSHPELSILSTKFSVGFDGGGNVGILDRPNDIALLAVASIDGEVEFALYLGMGERGDAPKFVGVNLKLNECIPILAGIAQVYRHGIEILGGDPRRKPRLRDVIHYWGLAAFSDRVQREFAGYSQFVFKNSAPDPHSASLDVCAHLGIHLQCPTDTLARRYYLGVVLPLGRWQRRQIEELAAIAIEYGNGTLRLTPWQNLIIPDVIETKIGTVQQLVTDLGLVQIANHPTSLLRACAGTSGCQFAATDTQSDAIAISQYLSSQFNLDRPINIHLSGCDKSCAQHELADITLWGYGKTDPDSAAAGQYRLCISGSEKFGRMLAEHLSPEDLPLAISHLLTKYHQQRTSPTESFRAFTDRYFSTKSTAMNEGVDCIKV